MRTLWGNLNGKHGCHQIHFYEAPMASEYNTRAKSCGRAIRWVCIKTAKAIAWVFGISKRAKDSEIDF